MGPIDIQNANVDIVLRCITTMSTAMENLRRKITASRSELQKAVAEGRNISIHTVSEWSGFSPRTLRAAVKRKEIDGLVLGAVTLIPAWQAARLCGLTPPSDLRRAAA